MKYNPDKHHRQSIRLKGYDYSSPGAYFITICTHQRQCLFGEIVDGEMRLNALGQLVSDEWMRSCSIRREIDFDAWVIMPNHIHGLVWIHLSDVPQNLVGANGRLPLHEASHSTNQDRLVPPMKPRSLSSFIAGFKSATTKRINLTRNAAGTPVWQRNYYDHIIRSEASLCRIRQYIQNNPLSWQQDQLHPSNPSNW
ncbi:transposase [Pantanalinema sp. GBBB05]|uniref:transposase n=1 Tax=Pantanalinema sp. GBBB05 TaxID=2604139 RepID=UPI001DD18D77|nr:hypothetical protein [Pantanalinema sp. GBBB05]